MAIRRITTVSWAEANALLKSDPENIMFHGRKVRTRSQRYDLFRKSRVCVDCGKVGTVMALEHARLEPIRAHFNLYDENDILFTKDHIIPKSKGGKNHPSNYQTMCQPCNQRKGSKMPKPKPTTTKSSQIKQNELERGHEILAMLLLPTPKG